MVGLIALFSSSGILSASVYFARVTICRPNTNNNYLRRFGYAMITWTVVSASRVCEMRQVTGFARTDPIDKHLPRRQNALKADCGRTEERIPSENLGFGVTPRVPEFLQSATWLRVSLFIDPGRVNLSASRPGPQARNGSCKRSASRDYGMQSLWWARLEYVRDDVRSPTCRVSWGGSRSEW